MKQSKYLRDYLPADGGCLASAADFPLAVPAAACCAEGGCGALRFLRAGGRGCVPAPRGGIPRSDMMTVLLGQQVWSLPSLEVIRRVLTNDLNHV